MPDSLTSAARTADITGRRNTIILFVVAAVLLWSNLGAPPIYILDEARNAQAAREMMERHDFIVPTFNAELRPHKPPLHYYFMWTAYELFGVNAWGARFFSALMGWFTILLTWFFVKRFTDRESAFYTVLVLICSTHFLFEFRLSVPDPYLIFFITAGLFTFYAFMVEHKWYWFLLSAVSLALASLAKGPVALGLPGLAAVSWLMVERQWKKLFSWKWLLYAMIVAAVSVPWYLLVHQATHGAFTRGFFLDHNISRFEGAMEGHGGIFLLVPLFVFIGLLPLSVFAGESIRHRKAYRSVSLATFSTCVGALFIIFFSVSGTKLPNYPMPCYPFLAFLLGYWIRTAIKERQEVKRYPFIVLLVLTVVLLAGGFIGLGLEPALKSSQYWAWVLLIPVVTVALSLYRYKQSGLQRSMITLGMGYLIFNALFLAVVYPAVYQQNSVSKTIHLLHRDETAYAYKIYNPAFNFYLDKPVEVLHTREEVAARLAASPGARILTRENMLPELDSLPFKVLGKERDLFEMPVTVVLGGAE